MSGGEEEEDEDEEVFYESRDRVLSSSGSSTSASDDDDHAQQQQRRRRDAYPPAAAAAALDLWTSQPAPVQERRRRLLQTMGLAGDPSLARLEMGRSVSYDRPVRPPMLSPMPRSRSDGAVPASTPIHRSSSDSSNGAARPRRRISWLRTIRHVAGSMVAGSRDRRSSDEKDTSSEKGGRRSSSATDDSQDSAGAVHHGPERIKVRLYGKSYKELSGLFMNQEVPAHDGSIWSIKFSPDGRYLASAGVDCVIHVWEVLEFERRREENGVSNPFVAVMCNGSPEPTLALATVDGSHWDKKLRARVSQCRKSSSSDRLMVPEHVFGLSEKPVKTFEGHSEDVLDLCWSKSQYLLSSSMDKTVKLWNMSSVSCLKTFSHCDYVTCIQFNPVDDRYFISGSLDEKVRIWSIPKREIVDWHDLHEMVTAACYTPDGQSALVGSHKGSCHLYDTSDNKLIQKKQIDLQTKKKKSRQKKITGFQFLPGSSSKVLITSADSRIRVIDDFELVHKFKGFRNTNSQISACYAARGRYVISASENSHVYVWRNDDGPDEQRSSSSSSKGVVSVANSYEYFYCRDVTVAAALPSTAGSAATSRTNSRRKHQELDCVSEYPLPHAGDGDSSDFQQQQSRDDLSNGSNHSGGDRASATWPEELMTPTKQSPRSSTSLPDGDGAGQAPSRSAWGMAIATAGSGGQIRILQNFGFPVRV
ncbi:unnamed protein product [Triticum turgidum subsp. durum]|uniref:WD repeat-containing protein 44 n=1 Tax=Triticum turgidum subsp. durum TaxID=4567 RepID=A0A9R1RAJ2_TRITD|nr:unnamed protein product [Triticum turgidum subsp. durum]